MSTFNIYLATVVVPIVLIIAGSQYIVSKYTPMNMFNGTDRLSSGEFVITHESVHATPVTERGIGDARMRDQQTGACGTNKACLARQLYNRDNIACVRPRQNMTISPRVLHSQKGRSRFANVSQLKQCGRDVRWGGWGGWSQSSIRRKRGSVATGQNLEDAIIVERFFRRGPLAHLTAEDNVSYMSEGVFVEMGALDGITFSNTLSLEHCLGWTGLLIEAHPTNARKCRINRPCTPVYSGAACSLPQSVAYISKNGNGVSSTILDSNITDPRKTATTHIPIPCKPLSTIFKDHNLTRIHFFSLDVEGAELVVLKTIDWNAIQIDVLMVETTMIHTTVVSPDEHHVHNKTLAVRAYLKSVGMQRVPSKATVAERHPYYTKPLHLSISGSDIFLGNKDLVKYDERLW